MLGYSTHGKYKNLIFESQSGFIGSKWEDIIKTDFIEILCVCMCLWVRVWLGQCKLIWLAREIIQCQAIFSNNITLPSPRTIGFLVINLKIYS